MGGWGSVVGFSRFFGKFDEQFGVVDDFLEGGFAFGPGVRFRLLFWASEVLCPWVRTTSTSSLHIWCKRLKIGRLSACHSFRVLVQEAQVHRGDPSRQRLPKDIIVLARERS